jgi:hypothetical protein
VKRKRLCWRATFRDKPDSVRIETLVLTCEKPGLFYSILSDLMPEKNS